MAESTFRESFKAGSDAVMDKVKTLIHDGNVRLTALFAGEPPPDRLRQFV